MTSRSIAGTIRHGDRHLPTSIDVASLAPNAEITVFPWGRGAGGAEATHGRPRASFPPGAHPDARRRAVARTTRDRVEVLVEQDPYQPRQDHR